MYSITGGRFDARKDNGHLWSLLTDHYACKLIKDVLLTPGAGVNRLGGGMTRGGEFKRVKMSRNGAGVGWGT